MLASHAWKNAVTGPKPNACRGALDLTTLEARYRSEFRPYLAAADRHDLTVRLWIEMLRPL